MCVFGKNGWQCTDVLSISIIVGLRFWASFSALCCIFGVQVLLFNN